MTTQNCVYPTTTTVAPSSSRTTTTEVCEYDKAGKLLKRTVTTVTTHDSPSWHQYYYPSWTTGTGIYSSTTARTTNLVQ